MARQKNKKNTLNEDLIKEEIETFNEQKDIFDKSLPNFPSNKSIKLAQAADLNNLQTEIINS